jgi:hypothetical protein
MARWKREFRMFDRFGKWAFSYEARSAKGAVALNVTGPHGDTGFSFGLEFHSPVAIDDRPADHRRCFLLDGPCWHEGTSLGASETFEDMFPGIGETPSHTNMPDPAEILDMVCREGDLYFYREAA